MIIDLARKATNFKWDKWAGHAWRMPLDLNEVETLQNKTLDHCF